MKICKNCKLHFNTDAEGPYVELCSVHAAGRFHEDAERIRELTMARESDLQTIDNLRACFKENQKRIRELNKILAAEGYSGREVGDEE